MTNLAPECLGGGCSCIYIPHVFDHENIRWSEVRNLQGGALSSSRAVWAAPPLSSIKFKTQHAKDNAQESRRAGSQPTHRTQQGRMETEAGFLPFADPLLMLSDHPNSPPSQTRVNPTGLSAAASQLDYRTPTSSYTVVRILDTPKGARRDVSHEARELGAKRGLPWAKGQRARRGPLRRVDRPEGRRMDVHRHAPRR